MEIIKKMTAKAVDNSMEGVTIAFLGDSVTQGCFEIYKNESGVIEPVFDKRHSYPQYLYDMFCTLFPSVNVNIINAGISGDKAPKGLERLERDIVRHCPDLTVVCYGLNDKHGLAACNFCIFNFQHSFHSACYCYKEDAYSASFVQGFLLIWFQ